MRSRINIRSSNFVLALVLLLMPCVGFAVETLQIPVNDSFVLELPAIAKSVDLADAGFVEVNKGNSKQTLYLTGKRVGTTSMTITVAGGSTLKYRLVVGDRLEAIVAAFSKIPGITAKKQGGKVLLEGLISQKQELRQVNSLKQRYAGIVVDSTEVRLAQSNTIVNTLNRILADNDMANIRAHAYGRLIVLEGSPKDKQQAELAERIGKMIHPEVEARFSENSSGAPAIAIEVLFVEVSKEDAKEIGFPRAFGNSVQTAQPTGVAQAEITAITGSSKSGQMGLNWQIGGLRTFLQLIQQRSSSRVLANPRLVSRSSNAASFHSGKTIYFKSREIQDNQVIEKFNPINIGIELDITPTIDAIGQIDSKIKTSVSDIADVSIGEAPATTISEVDTAVTIRDGQTIMLSGLVRKAQQKTVDRVPVLADIPILGELFKSRKTNTQERELVILVTMSRIDAEDEKLKAAGYSLWEKAASDVEFRLHD